MAPDVTWLCLLPESTVMPIWVNADFSTSRKWPRRQFLKWIQNECNFTKPVTFMDTSQLKFMPP